MSGGIYAEPVAVGATDDCLFYHVMEVPGHGVVGGDWDLRGHEDAYLGGVGFADRRVLEIGPASGFLTFWMESQGASVVAVDLEEGGRWDMVPHSRVAAGAKDEFPERMRRMQNGFWLAHGAHGSSAQVHYGDVYALPQELGRFDVAVMAAVLLHIRDPLRVVEQCARIADRVVITDLHVPELDGLAVQQLHPTIDVPQWATWWRFSPKLFTQFLEVMGFRTEAVTFHEQIHVAAGRRHPMPMMTVVASRAPRLSRLARSRDVLAAVVGTARPQREPDSAAPPPATDEGLRERALVHTLLQRPEPPARDFGNVITGPIAARLDQEDWAAVAAVIDGVPEALWEAADEQTRTRLVLNFAAAYELPGALERTGLFSVTPPDEVHAMARGALVAGGDTFLADLVMGAANAAGVDVREGATVLDFGASSGRVIRMIAAGRPDLTCLACDPNEGAIAWAAANLPQARFFVSPLAPPLDLPDGSVDLAYAVSIWTHFAAKPALAWLAEMRRILRPGGALVMTTHGFDCLATRLRREEISRETAADAAAAMITTGHHFVDVFGEEGDWGVKDAGWGEAYFTLDWLADRTGPAWSTRLLWPGALDQTQDLIVLERR